MSFWNLILAEKDTIIIKICTYLLIIIIKYNNLEIGTILKLIII